MKLTNLEILADILVSAREDKKYSQRKLSYITGISNTEISKLEKAQRQSPNIEILKKIADALDINFEEILEVLGYIKSGYSFQDNTNVLKEEEREYIVNTLSETWNNDVNTQIDFKDKKELHNVLFNESTATPSYNSKDNEFSEIITLLNENKDILSSEKRKTSLYNLLKLHINTIRGDDE